MTNREWQRKSRRQDEYFKRKPLSEGVHDTFFPDRYSLIVWWRSSRSTSSPKKLSRDISFGNRSMEAAERGFRAPVFRISAHGISKRGNGVVISRKSNQIGGVSRLYAIIPILTLFVVYHPSSHLPCPEASNHAATQPPSVSTRVCSPCIVNGTPGR